MIPAASLGSGGLCLVVAVTGLAAAIGHRGLQPVVLAVLVAPLVWISFSLTLGVTPATELGAQRGQTSLHLAVAVGAGVAVVDLARRVGRPRRRRRLVIGLPLLLCCCALASLPLAFAGLGVVSYRGTTTGEEFHGATFATAMLGDAWTSDDHLTRIASNYYPTGGSTQPATAWLREGGGPLGCPTVLQSSWQTVGAQQYPEPPLSVSEGGVRGRPADRPRRLYDDRARSRHGRRPDPRARLLTGGAFTNGRDGRLAAAMGGPQPAGGTRSNSAPSSVAAGASRADR